MSFDYETLNPGIRTTVRWLHSVGYETCDSGDGKTHEVMRMPTAVLSTSKVTIREPTVVVTPPRYRMLVGSVSLPTGEETCQLRDFREYEPRFFFFLTEINPFGSPCDH